MSSYTIKVPVVLPKVKYDYEVGQQLIVMTEDYIDVGTAVVEEVEDQGETWRYTMVIRVYDNPDLGIDALELVKGRNYEKLTYREATGL